MWKCTINKHYPFRENQRKANCFKASNETRGTTTTRGVPAALKHTQGERKTKMLATWKPACHFQCLSLSKGAVVSMAATSWQQWTNDDKRRALGLCEGVQLEFTEPLHRLKHQLLAVAWQRTSVQTGTFTKTSANLTHHRYKFRPQEICNLHQWVISHSQNSKNISALGRAQK